MKLKNIYCSLSLIEHDDLYREITHPEKARRKLAVKAGITTKENYWLKSIIDCFMFSLAPSYVSESLNCNLLKSRVLRIQRECYTQGNICEVGWKNREGLWHLYSYAMTSLTQRYEWVWYNIAVIASNCTAPIGVELSKWINSHIIP
ncbi:uncharacterized protein LOC128250800 [Octopus bimaculoides]|uniref:uncharacterized protein LOC128250800 n=1 Tax=Octopus bimaculoides TaxID=37653 RepID=UPI0022E095E5|nr:uncharacterized protein LOC128250800 [Octopus bimaculoides]